MRPPMILKWNISDRAVMKTLLGRNGTGCVEVPSIDEMDDLKAAAARTQEAILRHVHEYYRS